MSRYVLLALLLLLLLVSRVDAATLLVRPDGSGEFVTVQAAVLAASPGDSILLADGIYRGVGNRGVQFHWKALTLRSDSGDPSACVLDCEGHDRGLYFKEGEGPDTVIEGLGIVAGQVTGNGRGGGIACVGAAPTIRGCVVSGCRTGPTAKGGGIYVSSAGPTIEGCTISSNSAGWGGGLYCEGVPTTLVSVERSIIWENCGTGPDIYASTGRVELTCCNVLPAGVGGDVVFLTDNVAADPLFCGAMPCAEAPAAGGVSISAPDPRVPRARALADPRSGPSAPATALRCRSARAAPPRVSAMS